MASDFSAVHQIIDTKLKEIDQALTHNVLKGNLNFGVHLNRYRHSAYLPGFLQKKKILVRVLWAETLLIPVFLLILPGDIVEKMNNEPLKTIGVTVLLSIISGLLFVHVPLRSLIAQSNTVQLEVKKMILEDIQKQIRELDKKEIHEREGKITAG